MNDHELQLKVQALNDGELPPVEAARISALLAENQPAGALFRELENTSAALAEYEAACTHPESREFFWSKIKREIDRLEAAAPERPRESALAFWLKYFVPAGALAALSLVAIFGMRPPGLVRTGVGDRLGMVAVETAMLNTGAVTYRDEAAGVTLVWLSFAGEKQFTPPTSPDTIP